MRNVYKMLVGKPEGKGPLGRHRDRWEVNIKMDLKKNHMWTGCTCLGIKTSDELL
jgi:hypothetical protein